MKTARKEFADLAACKSMWEQISTTWGGGYKKLGDDLKRAIIAERVLYSFAGFSESVKITPEMISARMQAMCEYCGIESA